MASKEWNRPMPSNDWNRPLPAAFEAKLDSMSRGDLIATIGSLYEMLHEKEHPPVPAGKCHFCGYPTASPSSEVDGRVIPPSCVVCAAGLGLHTSIPKAEPKPDPKNEPNTVPKCDGCGGPAVYRCCCKRCSREPDAEGRYHACESAQCRVAVDVKHDRVYRRDVRWGNL